MADADLPDDLMLTSQQVRALHDAGMGIGAHTVTHPILTRISDETARSEAGEGKRTLERLIGVPVTLFAYPNGRPGRDYDKRHVGLIRSLGFHAAVSTGWGAATRESDVYQLPRFTPYGRTPTEIGLRFMRNAWASVPVATQ
jgi:peptidoglycan/xylan/chitin deacetylase (PgdA/CDA1 family)